MTNYENASKMVLEAEEAVKKLEGYQRPQIEAKGSQILEQVGDYLFRVLEDCHHLSISPKYFDRIYLSCYPKEKYYIFYLGMEGYSIGMTPILKISQFGVDYLKNPKEKELMCLIHNWDRFKIELDNEIKNTIERKQKEVNEKLKHLTYVQDEINEFTI